MIYIQLKPLDIYVLLFNTEKEKIEFRSVQFILFIKEKKKEKKKIITIYIVNNLSAYHLKSFKNLECIMQMPLTKRIKRILVFL